jgi:hypothetical protein
MLAFLLYISYIVIFKHENSGFFAKSKSKEENIFPSKNAFPLAKKTYLLLFLRDQKKVIIPFVCPQNRPKLFFTRI